MKKLNLTPNKILLANLWTNKSKRILKRKDKKKKNHKEPPSTKNHKSSSLENKSEDETCVEF